MTLKHYDVNRYRYPLDVTAKRPDNYIEHESHLVDVSKPESRFIILQAGAFYTDSVKIYRQESQRETEGTDIKYLTPNLYGFRHMVESAVKCTGKSVASLLVLDSKVASGTYVVSYQCVGAEYTEVKDHLTGLVEAVNTTKKPVYYENVIGRPDRLYVPRHLHHWKDIHGAGPFYHLLTELISTLKRKVLSDDHEIYARLISIEMEVDRLPKISRGEFDDVVNHIRDAVASNDTLKTQLEENISNISTELGNRITQLENAHTARLDGLNNIVENCTTNITTLQQTTAQHQQSLEQLNTFVSTVPVHAITYLQDEVSEENRFSITDNGWGGMTLNVKKSSDLRTLKDKVDDHQQTIEAQGTSIAGINQRLDGVDEQIQEKGQQIQDITTWKEKTIDPKLEQHQTSISDINRRIETIVETNNNTSGEQGNRVTLLEAELPKVKTALDEYKSTTDASISDITDNVNNLTSSLDEKERGLDTKITQLDSKLTTSLAEKEQALTQKINQANASLAERKEEILGAIRDASSDLRGYTTRQVSGLQDTITTKEQTLNGKISELDQRLSDTIGEKEHALAEQIKTVQKASVDEDRAIRADVLTRVGELKRNLEGSITEKTNVLDTRLTSFQSDIEGYRREDEQRYQNEHNTKTQGSDLFGGLRTSFSEEWKAYEWTYDPPHTNGGWRELNRDEYIFNRQSDPKEPGYLMSRRDDVFFGRDMAIPVGSNRIYKLSMRLEGENSLISNLPEKAIKVAALDDCYFNIGEQGQFKAKTSAFVRKVSPGDMRNAKSVDVYCIIDKLNSDSGMAKLLVCPGDTGQLHITQMKLEDITDVYHLEQAHNTFKTSSEKEIGGIKADMTGVSDRLQQVEQELPSVKNNITSIQGSIRDIGVTTQSLRQDHTALSEKVDTEKNTLDSKILDISRKVDVLEASSGNTGNSISGLDNRLSSIEQINTEQTGELTTIKSDLSQAKTAIQTTLPNQIQEVDSKIDRVVNEKLQENNRQYDNRFLLKNYGNNLIADELFQDLDNWEAYDDPWLVKKNKTATEAIKTKFQNGIIHQPDDVWYSYKATFTLPAETAVGFGLSLTYQSDGPEAPDDVNNTTIKLFLVDTLKQKPSEDEMTSGPLYQEDRAAAMISYRQAIEHGQRHRNAETKKYLISSRSGPDEPHTDTFIVYADGPYGVEKTSVFRIAFKIQTQHEQVKYPYVFDASQMFSISEISNRVEQYENNTNDHNESINRQIAQIERTSSNISDKSLALDKKLDKEIQRATNRENDIEEDLKAHSTIGRNLIVDPMFLRTDEWSCYSKGSRHGNQSIPYHYFQRTGIASGLKPESTNDPHYIVVPNEDGSDFVKNLFYTSQYWITYDKSEIDVYPGIKLQMSIVLKMAHDSEHLPNVVVGLGLKHPNDVIDLFYQRTVTQIKESNQPIIERVEPLQHGLVKITITLDTSEYEDWKNNAPRYSSWKSPIFFYCRTPVITQILNISVHHVDDDNQYILNKIKTIDSSLGNVSELSNKIDQANTRIDSVESTQTTQLSRMSDRMTSIESINTTQNENIQRIQSTANDALSKANQNKLDLSKELMDDRKEVGFIPIHGTMVQQNYQLRIGMTGSLLVNTSVDGVSVFSISKEQYDTQGLRVPIQLGHIAQDIFSQAVSQPNDIMFRAAMGSNTRVLNTRIVVFHANSPNSLPLLATNSDEINYIKNLSIYKLLDSYLLTRYTENLQRTKIINIIRGFVKAITLGAKATLIVVMSDTHDSPVNAVVHYGNESYTHWIEHRVVQDAPAEIVASNGANEIATQGGQIESACFTEDLTQILQYNTMLSNFLYDSRILDNHLNELTNDNLILADEGISGWDILDRDKSKISMSSLRPLFGRNGNQKGLISLSNLDNTYWIYTGAKIPFTRDGQNRRFELTLSVNNPYVELDVSFVNYTPNEAGVATVESLTASNPFVRVRPYHVGGGGVTTAVKQGLYRLKYILDINDTQARSGSGYLCIRPTTGTTSSIYSVGYFCLTDLRGTFRHNPAAQEINRAQIIGAIGDDIKSFVRQYIAEQTSPAAAPTTSWNLSDFREQPGTEDWSEVSEVNGKLIAKGVILHNHENGTDNVVFAPSSTYVVNSTQRWAIPKEFVGRKAMITVRANTLRQDGQVINSAVRQMFIVLPSGAVQITIGALTSFGQYLSVSNNTDYEDAIYPRSVAFGAQDISGSVTIVV